MFSQYISIFFTNILVGRVPSISLGTSLDIDTLSVVLLNFMAEAFLTSIFYILFLYSIKNKILFSFISDKVLMVQNHAIKYKAKIDKYGTFGLLVFVFIPFWMTGPVVGIIIGHLMNFSLIKNITIISIGTFVAIFCWAIMIEYFIEYVRIFL